MTESFAFTGKARDYFRVWVVNLFLTIVTLGLYSPWAKVRKKRYLYGHTWLAGSNFDYHGNPWAILKGRLIAFAAFIAYSLAAHFSPRVGAAVLLAMTPAIPWLILRSLAFNAANSSWRHLRFHFAGRYVDALKAIAPFVLIPAGTLLAPLPERGKPLSGSFALAFLPGLVFVLFYPYVRAQLARLRVNGSAYGSTTFRCNARTRAFYAIYVKAFFIAVFFGIGISTVLGGIGAVAAGLSGIAEIAIFMALLAYVVVGGTILGYTQARVGNLLLNTSEMGGVRLRSHVLARKLMGIYVTNVFAIVCTVGLATPWAVVRTLRYRAACVSVETDTGLDGFSGRAVRAVDATGEEMGDLFAVDLSL